MPVFRNSLLICAALAAFPVTAHAATVSHRSCTKPRTNDCVVKTHTIALSTTYFQNASRVGGTALASYPLARVSYGVTQGASVFYDAPNELAVSSHGGHYEMVHAGYGAQGSIAQLGDMDLTLTAESRPPLDPLENLYLLPLSDVHVTAAFDSSMNPDSTAFTAQVGTLNYIATNRDHRRSSAFDDVAATQTVGDGTWFTGLLGMQSNATYQGTGQTRGIASVKRSLGEDVLANVDLGTTFNVAHSNSKPHYLGAGFTILR
jgi:hypothetical protein